MKHQRALQFPITFLFLFSWLTNNWRRCRLTSVRRGTQKRNISPFVTYLRLLTMYVKYYKAFGSLHRYIYATLLTFRRPMQPLPSASIWHCHPEDVGSIYRRKACNTAHITLLRPKSRVNNEQEWEPKIRNVCEICIPFKNLSQNNLFSCRSTNTKINTVVCVSCGWQNIRGSVAPRAGFNSLHSSWQIFHSKAGNRSIKPSID
jgi:hypothetical protein